jgi:hypothetical protein
MMGGGGRVEVLGGMESGVGGGGAYPPIFRGVSSTF